MFSHYIILDFEATCEAHQRIANPEIIEFPFVIVNARTHAMECEFRRYVQPVIRPRLSAFCTHLTGITQATVNASQPFPFVYHEALQFLQERNFDISSRWQEEELLTKKEAPSQKHNVQEELSQNEHDREWETWRYCIVTCGDWDLQTMLPCQLALCGDSNLPFPSAWQHWCNLKIWMRQHLHEIVHCSSYSSTTANNNNNYNANSKHNPLPRINDLPDLFQVINLELCGKHHSGLDDCRNIARVVCALLDRGFTLTPTKCIANTVSTNSNNSHGFTKLPLQFTPKHLRSSHESNLCLQYENKRHESSVCMADGQVKVYHGVEINTSHVNKHVNSEERMEEEILESNKQCTSSETSFQNNVNDAKRERTMWPQQHQNKNTSTVEVPVRTHVIIDVTRDALHDILANTCEQNHLQVCTETNASHLSGAIERKVSHSLSNILRHSADRMHVPISTEGFVNVDDLLQLPEMKRYHVNLLDLALLVEHNDKQRFCLYYGTLEDQNTNSNSNSINDSSKKQQIYIAANQGHSLANVTPLLTRITSPYIVKLCNALENAIYRNNKINVNVHPPKEERECEQEEEIIAVHGTSLSAWEAIKSCGFLSPMSRQHIHFALMNNVLPVQSSQEQANPQKPLPISGLRKNAEVWLYLNVACALDDGVELWQSKNNVILTCGEGTSRTLPLKYIKRAVLAKTKTKLDYELYQLQYYFQKRKEK